MRTAQQRNLKFRNFTGASPVLATIYSSDKIKILLLGSKPANKQTFICMFSVILLAV